MQATATTTEAAADTVTIVYGVLGADVVSAVTVPQCATVFDLQHAIADAMHERDRVALLKLYKATDLPNSDAVNLETTPRTFLQENPYRLPRDVKAMLPYYTLNDPRCFGSRFPTRNDGVHVLVKLPTPTAPTMQPSKRQRIEDDTVEEVAWKFAAGEFPPLFTLDDRDAFVTLPYRYVKGSGVDTPQRHGELLLYRRDGFDHLWREMQRCVIDCSANLYIVGASGVGKSATAFAFACGRVDRRQWTVVWIHWSSSARHLRLMVFKGNQKATTRLTMVRPDVLTNVLEKLETDSGDKKMLVFLDGYEPSHDRCRLAEDRLVLWREANRKKRRFVCVTSRLSMGKQHRHGNVLFQPPGHPGATVFSQMECTLPSWRLDEYLDAVHDPRFVQTLRRDLFSHDGAGASGRPEEQSLLSLVCAKYFVVGGSARLMFCCTTVEALTSLNRALKHVGDLSDVLYTNVGVTSSPATKRLFARYDVHGFDVHLVSLYVARLVALRVGPEGMARLAAIVRFHPTLAVNGIRLVDWFLLSLASLGVCYYGLVGDAIDTEYQYWKTYVVHAFDALRDPLVLKQGWNVPEQWNEPGVDAVYWEVTPATEGQRGQQRLRFVQLTSSRTMEKLNCKPFQHLVQRLTTALSAPNGHCDADTKHAPVELPEFAIELYYVVPTSNLRAFQVPMTDDDFRECVAIPALLRLSHAVTCAVRVVGVEFNAADPVGMARERQTVHRSATGSLLQPSRPFA